MASKKRQRRSLAKQLKELRAKHKKLLLKVEKARAKFEKRSVKLRTLETQLARLESRFYAPEAQRLGQAPGDDVVLRDARLIYNPKSGANAKGTFSLDDVVGCLRAHGIRADIGVKTSGKAARELAKEAADNGIDLVIVAGGDGTIEEVASQLVNSKTTLGIIPVGTMNNLARSLGVPLELNDACALLGMGATRKIDMGHVLANEKPEIEYFMETAGLGLTAIAFPLGQNAKKGRWAGIPSALKKLFDFKPTPILVELDDGQAIQANSQLVTVSNAPMLGLNFLIAPEAKMDDGLLDVAIYDGMNKADLLGYFMAAMNGKMATNPKIKKFKAHHVRIRSPQPEPVVADKDAIPDKHMLDIEVVPQGLTMIVGKGIGLTLPVEAVPSVPPLSGPQPPANGNDAPKPEAPIDQPSDQQQNNPQ